MAPGAEKHQMNAASVGSHAWDTFTAGLSGVVTGVTTGGIFVRAGTDRIVFISRSGFCSPLTITLGPDRSALQLLEAGMAAEFSAVQLFFPEAGLEILIEPGVRWTAPPPAAGVSIEPDEVAARLYELAALVQQQKGEIGLGVLLPGLLGLPVLGDELDLVAERVMAVRAALKKGQGVSPENDLSTLLGLGRGLTPSGDDLMVGFLLTLNRWRTILRLPMDLHRLNDRIIGAAYQTTTHLSANLIECGAAGAADERLLDGLDYVVTGQGNPGLIATHLSEMGSSSGVDSLVGMVLAFEVCGML